MAEHQTKMAERAAQKESGRKPRGPDPKIPSPQPKPSEQYNFTDPESRIMKAGNGQHFEQSFNAQAAVEVDSRLLWGSESAALLTTNKNWFPTWRRLPDRWRRSPRY